GELSGDLGFTGFDHGGHPAGLFQSRGLEHGKKLTFRAHVDRLRDDPAIPAVHECLRNPFDAEQVVDLAAGIEQNRVSKSLRLNKRTDLAGVVIGDSENNETFRLELLVQGLKVRHFLAAWRAPSCPEIEHHDLALEILQGPRSSTQVSQGKTDRVAC